MGSGRKVASIEEAVHRIRSETASAVPMVRAGVPSDIAADPAEAVMVIAA
ncbi:hypothetical protein ACQEVS_20100 [Streptomyces sp. CA-181903]